MLHFHYNTKMATPSHRKPCKVGHEIYNFDRGSTVLSIQFFSAIWADLDWLIDWIVFYAVSAIFQPCNGGHMGRSGEENFWNWSNFGIFYSRAPWVQEFGWNWSSGSDKIFLFRQCIITIWKLSPLEKGGLLHMKKNWIPLIQGCFVPSLVEIGPVVLEKICFKFPQCMFVISLLSHLGKGQDPSFE